MKYTLICEDNIGQYWKNNLEFEVDFLDNVVENFELFLKGCGFHYQGNLKFENEEFSFKEYENNFDEEKQKVSNNVMDFVVNSLYMWDKDSKKVMVSNQTEVCEICKLPFFIAERKYCNDSSCPVKHAN